MSLIGLLVALLVFCVIVWAARSLMAAFNMPPQIQTVVTVLIVVVFVLWIVSGLGLWTGDPVLRLR